MKKIIVSIILSGFAFMLEAQMIRDTLYFNKNWKLSTVENAHYFRIITNDTTGKFLFHVNDYYLTGQLQMTGLYRSISPDFKTGPFVYYYPNGKKQIMCTYSDNQLEGKYMEWFDNGQPKTEKYYKHNLLNGTEKAWSKEGELLKKAGYKDGMKNGYFYTYYNNGQPVRKDRYKNDKFIDGKCFTREGKDTTYFAYFVMPKFQGEGLGAFKNFVLEQLQYPDTAMNKLEEGRVFINFTINKLGQVVKAHIVKADKDYFNEEALRVIKSSPKWLPGKKDGKLVDVNITVPIRFAIK